MKIKKLLEKHARGLCTEQEIVLEKLVRGIFRSLDKKNPKPEDRVFAIAGARGSGKSTVMKCLHETLLDSGECETTAIVDAAVVDEDQGIMAACIQALWHTLDLPDSPDGPAGFSLEEKRSRSPLEDLEKRFQACHGTALIQGESHREIAREMAMSPDQYALMVQKNAERKLHTGRDFTSFIEELQAARVRAGQAKKDHLFIFIDDLDLIQPDHLVRNWARAFVHSYREANVFWILGFDRERLCLSLSCPGFDGEKGTPDRATGQALLNKIVAYHRLLKLDIWQPKEKVEFQPFDEEDRQGDLEKLLNRARHFLMAPILPNYPLGLQGIYNWLRETLEGLKTGEDIPADRLLREIANVNGATGLASRLKSISSAQILNGLHWDSEQVLSSKIVWQGLIKDIHEERPLLDLPLPGKLRDLVGRGMPESYLEVIANLGLSSDDITPYHLLSTMPFTRARLKKCSAVYTFRESMIKRLFQSKPEAARRSLLFQEWSEMPEKKAWKALMSPTVFIDAVYDQRTFLPVSMLKTLNMNNPPLLESLMEALDEAREPLKSKSDPLLPKNFRALLLAVDGLSKAPWRELEAVRRFWGPLPFVQNVAAFCLSGLVYAIWGREALKPSTTDHKAIMFFPNEHFAAIQRLDEAEVNASYHNLIQELKKRTQNAPNEKFKVSAGDAGKPLLMEARRELYKTLKKVLELPAVTRLAQPGQPK